MHDRGDARASAAGLSLRQWEGAIDRRAFWWRVCVAGPLGRLARAAAGGCVDGHMGRARAGTDPPRSAPFPSRGGRGRGRAPGLVRRREQLPPRRPVPHVERHERAGTQPSWRQISRCAPRTTRHRLLQPREPAGCLPGGLVAQRHGSVDAVLRGRHSIRRLRNIRADRTTQMRHLTIDAFAPPCWTCKLDGANRHRQYTNDRNLTEPHHDRGVARRSVGGTDRHCATSTKVLWRIFLR